MLKIETAAALEALADPQLRPILARYGALMDLAVIYIIETGDGLDELYKQRKRPFADWEFILSHSSGWFEAVLITCDDGAGDVVLVPDRPDIDPQLLGLCRANSVPPDSIL